MSEYFLNICNFQIELFGEGQFFYERDKVKVALHRADTLLSYSYCWQVGILEKSVVWFLIFESETYSLIHICIISSCFRKRLCTFAQKVNMPKIFKLQSSLDIFCSCNVLNFNSASLFIWTTHGNINIDSHLTRGNLGIRNSQCTQKFLKLSNNEFCITWMYLLCISNNLEQRHSCSVIVNEYFSSVINAFCGILFHLDSLYIYRVLFIFEIKEIQPSINHYRIVLLRDLVRLWEVCILIMLTVKFYSRQNTSIQCN